MKTYTTTEEIFSVGYWNGMAFAAEDLQAIVDSFEHFKGMLDVPLKMGHKPGVEMDEDGQPALGWVDSVWVEGEKLMAKFVDIPELAYKAMQNKMYRNKSIELDIAVKHGDAEFDLVLTGVALLGAELPAVNGLNDLSAYVASRREGGNYNPTGRHACFSVGTGALFNKREDFEMEEIERLKQEMSALREQLTEATTQAATFKAQNEALERDKQEQAEAAAKAEFNRKVEDLRGEMETLVEAGLLTPAKRDQFSASLTDEATITAVKFTVEALSDQGKERGLFARSEQGGGQGGAAAGSPDVELDTIISDIVDKEQVDYATAQQRAFRRNPELARAYINMND